MAHLERSPVKALSQNYIDENVHYSFTPRPTTKVKAHHAWERKPAVPFAARSENQKIWKRYEMPGEEPIKPEIRRSKDAASKRSIKKIKLSGRDQPEGLTTKWDDGVEGGRIHKMVSRASPRPISLEQTFCVYPESLATASIGSQLIDESACEPEEAVLVNSDYQDDDDIEEENKLGDASANEDIDASRHGKEPEIFIELQHDEDHSSGEDGSASAPVLAGDGIASGATHENASNNSNRPADSAKISVQQAGESQTDADTQIVQTAESQMLAETEGRAQSADDVNTADGKDEGYQRQEEGAEEMSDASFLEDSFQVANQEEHPPQAITDFESEKTTLDGSQNSPADVASTVEGRVEDLSTAMAVEIAESMDAAPSPSAGRAIKKAILDPTDDDTALLQSFISRAKARKAAATIAALNVEENTGALSEVEIAHAASGLSDQIILSPSPKNKRKPSATSSEDVLIPESPVRRSKRNASACLPKNTEPSTSNRTPNQIPVLRRPNGTEFVFLTRTEAQEIALATRNNTRKNKGQAKEPKARLQEISSSTETDEVEQMESKSTSPVKRRKKAKTVVEGAGKEMKQVSWDEQLAYFEDDEEIQRELAPQNSVEPTRTTVKEDKKSSSSKGTKSSSSSTKNKSSSTKRAKRLTNGTPISRKILADPFDTIFEQQSSSKTTNRAPPTTAASLSSSNGGTTAPGSTKKPSSSSTITGISSFGSRLPTSSSSKSSASKRTTKPETRTSTRTSSRVAKPTPTSTSTTGTETGTIEVGSRTRSGRI
ncbi:putative c-14 sterol reductase [Phaeomoniella chlamydospora]|uniref:Putative c-14 sterol reductase n=1 Tax=Phaeomoniella chlamydospora TaxID=158046 RepID=A0A0G2EIN6_PHACM|nr:putative c-14 sterol reductase [Phaeomoniella chlamydospora]